MVAAAVAKCSRCGSPSSRSCSWKRHEVNEAGVREYDGTTCGVKLCDACGTIAGTGVLCPWHDLKARENGWL